MPYPSLLLPVPLPLWQATADPYLHRRCSNTVLSQSLWGPWFLVHTKFVWALSVSSGIGVWFYTWIRPSYHLVGASPLPLNMGYVPVLCSRRSSTYHLAGLSLILIVVYLLIAAPGQHSHCSSATYVNLKLLYPLDDLIHLSIYNNDLVPYYGFWLKVSFFLM